MGWGALGWNGDDGPVSFSAWSRQQLGWASVRDIESTSEELLLPSVGSTGQLFRIPIGASEHFLLEYRDREGSYYDRYIPAEGLLIWRIFRDQPTWKVDLVCADGLWREAGYPLGSTPQPVTGEDNLDFWAHDEEYAAQHAGNLGDSTDVFDGVRASSFGPLTNPRAVSLDGARSVSITQIERVSGGMRARVEVSAPKIEFGDITVVDDTDDGVLVAGEDMWLAFDPLNTGGLLATDVAFEIASHSPELTVHSTEGNIEDLALDTRALAGVIPRRNAPYLRVDPTFAGTRTLSVDLIATSKGSEIGRTRLEIPVVSARQEILGVEVLDERGDGRIDPGEFFHVRIQIAMDKVSLILS